MEILSTRGKFGRLCNGGIHRVTLLCGFPIAEDASSKAALLYPVRSDVREDEASLPTLAAAGATLEDADDPAPGATPK